jgi:PAS domain S-box-containing protein
VWVNSTLSLFRDESGEPEWWVSVVEDISDREQVEAKLRLFRSLRPTESSLR